MRARVQRRHRRVLAHRRRRGEPSRFAKRSVMVVQLLILAAALFLIGLQAVPVLLLIFLAILLAIFLRTLSDFVHDHSGWRFRWCMLIVVGGILGLSALGAFLLGPNASEQIRNVMNELPEVRQRIEQYGWATLLYHVPGMRELLSGRMNIWDRLTTSFTFSSTFGPLISLGLVIVIGLYLTGNPEMYVDGVVALAPPEKRDDARKIVCAVGDTLRWWLLGQSIGMAFIAVVVSVALELLGMPLAVTLGILAGLLAFIPNVGYFLSIAPAILLAVMQSPLTAFYVLVIYTGAHWTNDYVIIPYVQKRVVHLPPALTIAAQLLLGFLLGGIGLIIATPLTAVLLVLVKATYLGHDPESTRQAE